MGRFWLIRFVPRIGGGRWTGDEHASGAPVGADSVAARTCCTKTAQNVDYLRRVVVVRAILAANIAVLQDQPRGAPVSS